MEDDLQRLVESQKTRKSSIQTKVKNELDRKEQSLINDKRNRILAEKQIILNEIYAEAAKKMTVWDTETFRKFVENVLNQFDSNTLQLVPGEKTRGQFTEEFVEQLKKDYPGLKISSSAIPNRAGFIVEKGGIDYNFFFDQMIAEIKKDFSPKLASLAFQKK
ncbi:hypothetical protein LZ578_08010 [Jeotgalibaca sp. MA1X17-3]|uniref:hypothetical protein n=1 Tax=Jeotgalibaca sp. MA1X17-3 TaxID=2908211 RepID=UPI001F1F6CEA|nr:hypothetical protein [Jeotgalibaca sp. MA1X17-3]UJF14952.1 hypothetical protein LZ578_08010 [Jeotgalibaca sp. MA1X17-3]